MVCEFPQRGTLWYGARQSEDECDYCKDRDCAEQDCYPSRGDRWDGAAEEGALDGHLDIRARQSLQRRVDTDAKIIAALMCDIYSGG